MALLGVIAVGQPAQADGGQSADEGYVMVQQALSFLVNEPGEDGTAEALMRVDNALAAEDQDGVDVSMVNEARDALVAGDTVAARTLLQDSITEAINELSPAVGEQTGTTIVLAPFPPRGPLSLVEWMLLALSAIALAIGIALSVRFRPGESLKELRRDISDAAGENSKRSEATVAGEK